jgi:photosystem II stability/assembly factor-like uncharacterized protein
MINIQRRPLIFWLITGGLLAILLVGILFAAKARALSFAKNIHRVRFIDMQMIDPRTGWALDQDMMHIYYTHDGVEHWSDVTPRMLLHSRMTLSEDLDFVDANHAVLGAYNNGWLEIIKTNNRGAAWQSFLVRREAAAIIQIDFVDALHGWLVLDKGISTGQVPIELLHTIDGGAHWTQLLDTTKPRAGNLPDSGLKYIHFINATTGWTTGGDYSNAVRMYMTTDGGANWRQQRVPSPAGMPGRPTSHQIILRDAAHFMLPVTYFDGKNQYLVTDYSNDSGKTWITGTPLHLASGRDALQFSFLNSQQGWVAGQQANGGVVMHHTINGGKTWTTWNVNLGKLFPSTITTLEFSSPSLGWMIVDNGDMSDSTYQTVDGGKTWQLIVPTIG